MFTIQFKTIEFRPDLLITLRTDILGWEKDLPGEYIDDAWKFELDETDFPNGLSFKFFLENSYWMSGDNLRLVNPVDGDVYIYENLDFAPIDELVVENGIVQQMFFQPNLNEDEDYDVIVIGSGMGGGILADELSDMDLKVLVLEAGSYLFPTHIANLPRQHQVGQFDKHVWGLWDEFQTRNYNSAPGSGYNGAQGFNLGGRSVFWGGLIPKMASYEMDLWAAAVNSQEIKWYLEDSGYQKAENLMNASPIPPSTYHNQIKGALRRFLPDYNHFDAPVAVQYSNGNLATIPAGMFSTADLLMESRLTDSSVGNQNLTINLNHAVTKIETDGNKATGVTAYDLIARKERTYKGKNVVLAAGTVESAKLAFLSGLNDASDKIGQGMTDHPVFFTHFAIPNTSPFYDSSNNSKILSQHKLANSTPSPHPYNMVLELGADFNQGRYVDDDILAEHLKERGNTMLCEIVFLLNAPLKEENNLTQTGSSGVKPLIQMQPNDLPDGLREQLEELKDRVINQQGGISLAGGSLALQTAGLGGVAHEVGTLRMNQDANAGVVDLNLKFHQYDNLYACDLSVFPTSPAANPSLTLAALAIMLAEHLKSLDD